MKKAIKLFAAITMIIGASYVNANGTTLEANVVSNTRFRAEVSNVHGPSISYIRDKSGQILYKNKSKENKLRFVFDFGNLKPGTYELVVKDEFKEQIQPIHLNDSGIEINEEELKKIFFPRLEQYEDGVLIKLLSDETNDLSVSIKLDNGTVLFEEIIDAKTGLIGRKYLLRPGDYMVTMISDDFAKTKNIKIR